MTPEFTPRPFEPFSRNRHLLTIAGNFWPRKIDEHRFPAIRKVYEIDELTHVVSFEHQPDGPARAQVVCLHGLEGSADAGYIRSLAQNALLRGFGVHRINLRSCGQTENICETMYHSGLTGDNLRILQEIRRRDMGPVFLIGFSLGGNVALKLTAELGTTDLIAATCAVSTPIDLAASVRRIDAPSNSIYASRFLRRLKDRIRRKSALSPHLYTTKGLNAVKTIRDFDDRFTAPLFGFGTAANYYESQSAIRYLHNIQVPTLLIAGKDDPLVPFEIYDHPQIRKNRALKLLVTDHGGHLGFISKRAPRFWLDNVALDWFEHVLAHGRLAAPASQGTIFSSSSSG